MTSIRLNQFIINLFIYQGHVQHICTSMGKVYAYVIGQGHVQHISVQAWVRYRPLLLVRVQFSVLSIVGGHVDKDFTGGYLKIFSNLLHYIYI